MRTQPSFLGLACLIVVFAGVLACGDVERAAVESVAAAGSTGQPLADAERNDDSWIDFSSARGGPDARAADSATGERPKKKTAGVAQRTWSPTGEWIVYVAQRDAQTDLFLARADGSGEVRLTDDAAVDRYPVWSPDGQAIAFARQDEAGWGVFTLSPFDANSESAATPQRLTEMGDYVRHLDWSPDGTKIAFDRVSAGRTQITVVDLETAEVRVL